MNICKSSKLNLPIVQGSVNEIIIVPFKAGRAEKGAIVIETKTGNSGPLDLPAQELKNLVRGIVWRDEHFNGKTLREIAKKNGLSEGYVGKCIFQSFEILRAQAAKTA